jgi:hypothetical protein
MNDTRRKMLTEYLGECWHEITDKGPYQSTCSKCGITFGAIHSSDWNPTGFNRTFTTAHDMVDLVKKMEELDGWYYFVEEYALPLFIKDDSLEFNSSGSQLSWFTFWLITDPARTCELIAEWMEAEHETIKNRPTA